MPSLDRSWRRNNKERGGGINVDVMDGIAVGDGSGVKSSIVTTWTPTVGLLVHDVKDRRPGTLEAASCADPQHGVELGFGDGEPVWSKPPWTAGDWWTWCSPDVVDGAVAHLAQDTRGSNEVWKLGENSVDRRTATDDFHTGGLRTGSFGRGGQRRDCVQQTVVLTAPMRGCVKSATTKRHVNSRRNPRLRLRGSHP
jgi:hypothetical protein